MLKSFKTSLALFAIGNGWLLSPGSIILVLTNTFKEQNQDLFRNLINFIFVIGMAYVLYCEINRMNRQPARSEPGYRRRSEANQNPRWINRNNNLRLVNLNDTAKILWDYRRLKFLITPIAVPFKQRIKFFNELETIQIKLKILGLTT
ncbi:hypothetical protein ABIB50_005153 [Mucilaginibacter sp. UYCu711]